MKHPFKIIMNLSLYFHWFLWWTHRFTDSSVAFGQTTCKKLQHAVCLSCVLSLDLSQCKLCADDGREDSDMHWALHVNPQIPDPRKTPCKCNEPFQRGTTGSWPSDTLFHFEKRNSIQSITYIVRLSDVCVICRSYWLTTIRLSPQHTCIITTYYCCSEAWQLCSTNRTRVCF